jgi:PHS family inorganic phosphate transporter-like MFS transporter
MNLQSLSTWSVSDSFLFRFSSPRSRSRLMAAVFLMEPFSNLIASALTLVLLVALGRNSGLTAEVDEQNAALVVDKMWRLVVGLGGVPAVITLFLRMAMPESPRYTLDRYNEERSPYNESEATENEIRFEYYFMASRFLRRLGNWRHLVGISICAFTLNAARVSLGADNYRVLAQIWDFDMSHTNTTTTLPAWTDGRHASAIPGAAIYGVLFDFSLHSIFTQSIASVVSSLALVMIVKHFFFRRSVLIYYSLNLAILFIILASISLPTPVSSATRGAIIAMTILSYFTFSLGLTLIQEF